MSDREAPAPIRWLLREHQLSSFVVLAYVLSWADWVPLALRGARVVPGGAVTHFPGLLGPALAAFIVTGAAHGVPGVGRLVRRLVLVAQPAPRFLAYSLGPLGFIALALLATRIAGRDLPPASDFSRYPGLPALAPVTVTLLVFVVNGYGEETGWRGFALARLQQRFGPVTGTLVLALIWAGWHAPLFWIVEGYRSLGVAGLIGGFGLGICAGSLVLARVAHQTAGSILAVALWHATYNLASATAGGRGAVAALTTTWVMIWAVVLLVQEWRRPLARSRLAVEAAD